MKKTPLGVVLAVALSAQAQNRSAEDLAKELEALRTKLQSHEAIIEAQQAQIQQLKQQVGPDAEERWLNERRAEEIKSLVREVLADAATRASLLENALVAGHSGQFFFLASEDGNYFLRIEGLLQGRFIYNHRETSPDLVLSPEAGNAGGDRNEAGFEIARTKLEFSGHVGSPRLQYLVRIGVDREDNEVLGERVVLGYQFTDDLTLWGGEDKAPFLREEITGPAQQLAVERSLMNEIFTAGYVQGLWITWHALEEISLAVSINDGFRSGEADNEANSVNLIATNPKATHKPFFDDRADFAITARADFKAAGDWRQWEDFSAWPDEELAVFVGVATHFELGDGESGSVNELNEDDDFLVWTLDGSMEWGGFNLFAAIAGFHTGLDGSASDIINNLDMYGAVIQAGYMVIPAKLEPFARFEWIDLDGNIDEGDDTDQMVLLTLGANYYLNRHRAKFTFDVLWLFNQLPDSEWLGIQSNFANDAGLGALGLRQDQFRRDNQVVIRGQFQVLF